MNQENTALLEALDKILREGTDRALAAPNGLRPAILAQTIGEARQFISSSPTQSSGEAGIPCERCQGNGEIVTDWERYMHSQCGDKGDEGTEDCPDCNGTGRVDETATPTTDSLTADAAAVREHWLEPYRSMDAGGSPEAAGQVGHSWLIDIAREEHGNDPAALEIDMPRLTEDGAAQILYRGPKVLAAAFIVRDPMNYSILFRYRALPLPAQTVPADVAALAVAAREAVEFLDCYYPGEEKTGDLDKALEPFASRVCWGDEGGSLPDAHAVPCSCGAAQTVTVQPGPCKHRWVHAPTVGYYQCADCNERHDHGSPMYAALAQPKGGE